MRRVDIVFSAYEKFGLFFEHQETKSSPRRAGGNTDQESARRRQQILPVLEAPRGVRDTGTRVSA